MTNQEKEKFLRLTTYVNEMKSKLADKEVPAKHAGHPKEYRQFLVFEINATEKKLADMALTAGPVRK